MKIVPNLNHVFRLLCFLSIFVVNRTKIDKFKRILIDKILGDKIGDLFLNVAEETILKVKVNLCD